MIIRMICIKNAEDVMRKRQQINKIAATPGLEKERVAALR